ncbi:hypothetical protein R1flu_024234 [Riccia fluitans]|uniref:Uncharacterized protein n=1 Tax=Riccia fluitans TaxID=41844 RepID=A0ABD1XUB1_9MARC
MEYMAGVFTVEEQIGTSRETHLKFEMKEKYVQRKSGLFVDGVVIRQQHNVDELSLSEDSEPEDRNSDDRTAETRLHGFRGRVYVQSGLEVDTKRANKNRLMEVTSKKPVGRFREVIQAPKRVM